MERLNRLILIILKNFLLTVLTGASIVGCSDSSLHSINGVIVFTSVTHVENDGVTLNAKLVSPANETIVDFGFIWSDGVKNYKQSVLKSADYSEFDYKITSDLTPNVMYTCYAYIKTKNHLTYGNKVTFQSLGSSAPVISTVYPITVFELSEFQRKNPWAKVVHAF